MTTVAVTKVDSFDYNYEDVDKAMEENTGTGIAFWFA